MSGPAVLFARPYGGQPPLPGVGLLMGRAVPVLAELPSPEEGAKEAARAAAVARAAGRLWDTEGGDVTVAVELVTRLVRAATAVDPSTPDYVYQFGVEDDLVPEELAKLPDPAPFMGWWGRRMLAPRVKGAGLAFDLYLRPGIPIHRWADSAALLMTAYKAMGLPVLALVSPCLKGESELISAADFAFMVRFVTAHMGRVCVWGDPSIPWAQFRATPYGAAILAAAAAPIGSA